MTPSPARRLGRAPHELGPRAPEHGPGGDLGGGDRAPDVRGHGGEPDPARGLAALQARDVRREGERGLAQVAPRRRARRAPQARVQARAGRRVRHRGGHHRGLPQAQPGELRPPSRVRARRRAPRGREPLPRRRPRGIPLLHQVRTQPTLPRRLPRGGAPRHGGRARALGDHVRRRRAVRARERLRAQLLPAPPLVERARGRRRGFPKVAARGRRQARPRAAVGPGRHRRRRWTARPSRCSSIFSPRTRS